METTSHDVTTTDRSENTSKWRTVRIIIGHITVEPLVLLYLFPTMLLAIPIINLDLEKSCRVNLKFNDTVCDALISQNTSIYTSEQEDMVQREVASMNVWKNIIKGVVPTCLLLIIGAWSDKYNRRKPVIGLPIFGQCIAIGGFILCTFFFYEIPMEVTGFFDSVPPSLSGGPSTFSMGIFSYITAISTMKSRTVRIGVAKMFLDASMMLGAVLGGISYRVLGLYGICFGVLTLYIFGFVYLIFVIKEKQMDKTNSNLNVSKSQICKDFFNVQHIKPTFMVAVKPRKRNYRARISATLALIILTLGPVYGENSVMYLFARKRFHWNEVEFSIFQGSCLVVQLVGTLTAVSILSKRLNLPDAIVGMICYVGKLFAVCLYAFAKAPWVLGIGVFVDALSATTVITVRSMGTKFVSEDEIGRLNSLMAILETLMPSICASLYTVVYRATIDILPGAFYLIGGVMWIPCMILLGWLHVQQKRDIAEEENTKNVISI